MCDSRNHGCEHSNDRPAEDGVSRRHFLGAVPAIVLAGQQMLSAAPNSPQAGDAHSHGSGASQAPMKSAGKTDRIDVHFHMVPPSYAAAQRQRILQITSGDASVLDWTPDKALEQMGHNGIATGMLSLPVPGAWVGDIPSSRKLSRSSNEWAAKLVSDRPSQFGLFAGIPLPDTEGSLKEIEYAFDVLKADGIGLNTSYGDKWPGDPAFAPVFEELNRRKAIVFIHPTEPSCCGNLIPGVSSSTVEFLFDTTRSIASLLANGTFARFPDIRFIFCHCGGTMPVLAWRMSGYMDNKKEIKARNSHGAMYELKKLHFDIANATNPSSLAALLNMVSTSQIMFGSDYPYRPVPLTTTGWDKYDIAPDVRRAIDRENALRLFPRLQSKA